MARSDFVFTIILLLLITSLCCNIVARPINVAKSIDYADDAIFSLAAIKHGGGPSAGGKGHEFPTADSFGNIKNLGPSHGGKGHDFTDDKNLGDIKNSGPSPGGKGHGFSDAESLGNIKNSGPSSGGKGHGFTTVELHATGKEHEFPTSVDTHHSNMNKSGPSPGGKRYSFPESKNLWNLNKSGPSPGGKGH
ncbi:hypothetical protein L6452_06421 [Arctium lappa]|uniref:Uncharacterized protein n=1 Tax=Arctium lappa TaxID=4217 RepID=A0ACB9EIU5_ARCLA|nr:hypothetical protein L6452_06421 [Arctium lappa]